MVPVRRGPVPLVGFLPLFLAKSSHKLFCEIAEDSCWFLHEFWWVQAFPRFSEDLKVFVGVLGAAGPLGPVVPQAFVSLCLRPF